MKRDMDLGRRILLDLEKDETCDTGSKWNCLTEDGTPPEKVSYHVMLLHEAGLIVAVDLSDSEFLWEPIRLTWEGHEFLDASREESRWQKAKTVVKEKTGGLAYEALKAVLMKWGMDALANMPLPL